MPWNGLEAFVAVADAGSIRAAAAKLNVQPPAVSQSLGKLEEELGTILFQRSTRALNITDAGRTLLAAARPGMATIQDGLEALSSESKSPEGLIRLTAPLFVLESVLLEAIADFQRLFPDITFDLDASDRLDSLVEDGFDAGIRLEEKLHLDHIAVRITPPLREGVFASPAYLEAHGTPQHPADLLEHTCIRYRYASGRLSDWNFLRGDTALTIDPPAYLQTGDTRILVDAAVQGLGVGYIVRPAAQRFIRSGQLISVLENWTPTIPGFFLYYPKSATMTRRFRAFVDFIKRWRTL